MGTIELWDVGQKAINVAANLVDEFKTDQRITLKFSHGDYTKKIAIKPAVAFLGEYVISTTFSGGGWKQPTTSDIIATFQEAKEAINSLVAVAYHHGVSVEVL